MMVSPDGGDLTYNFARASRIRSDHGLPPFDEERLFRRSANKEGLHHHRGQAGVFAVVGVVTT